MNDRFKFRFWVDLEDEPAKMVYPEDYEYWNYDWDMNDLFDGLPEYKPMQCTGLKDKNGKLIYEGDILARVKHHNRIVEWDRGSFLLRPLGFEAKGVYRIHGFLRDGKAEVIGNIYEHKHLLEGRRME